MTEHWKSVCWCLFLTGVPVLSGGAAPPFVDGDHDGIPESWEVGHGLSDSNPADALLDIDGDSLSALLEFGLGGNPNVREPSLLPVFALESTELGQTYVTVTFSRRRGYDHLVIRPEFAVDLGVTELWSWEAMELSASPTGSADLDQVTYRTKLPVTGSSAGFVRVRLSVSVATLLSGLGSEVEVTGVGGSLHSTPGFVAGMVGQAVDLTQSGDAVSFPVAGNVDLGAGELSFWYRPDYAADAETTERVLFAAGTYPGSPHLALVKTDRLTLSLNTGTESASVASLPNAALWRAGQWVQVRAAWDSFASDSLQIFINGVRVDQGGAAGGWLFDGGNLPGTLFLGAADGSGSLGAGGAFDELCVRSVPQIWEDTNTPPYLIPVEDQFAVEGAAFNLTPLFGDLNPLDNLTFSLDPGAPPGAVIDPATGVFSYTPQIGMGNRFYEFEIRVTDNGAPANTFSTPVYLVVAGNTAPVLSNLLPATQTATHSDSPSVGFHWEDIDADIQYVEMTVQSPLETMSDQAQASVFLIKGTSGNAMVPLDPSSLPFGNTVYSFKLMDSRGNESATLSSTLTVAGPQPPSPGDEPVIQSIDYAASPVQRPLGNLDVAYLNVTMTISDPNEDARRLRLLVDPPGSGNDKTVDLTLEELGVDPSGPYPLTVNLRPVQLKNNSPTGSYFVQARVFDANGNESALAQTTISVATFSSDPNKQASSYISGVEDMNYNSLSSGRWGDVVTLTGGFPTSDEGNPAFEEIRIEIGGEVCEILQRNNQEAQVRIPVGARSGPFLMTTEFGSQAVSPEVFDIASEVRLDPLEVGGAEDEAGAPLANAAVRIGPSDTFSFRWVTTSFETDAVDWLVNGVAGGDALLGTISKAGVYTAPPVVTTEFQAVIRAQLKSDPGVFDSFELTVASGAISPGTGLVVAQAGGEIVSEDGETTLRIPAGSLTSDTMISVEPLMSGELPSPRAGRRNLGGVRFGPEGTIFSTPASATIPLTCVKPAGTLLPVLTYDSGSGSYMAEGSQAVVSEDGRNAIFPVSHFSDYVLDDTEPAAMTGAPSVSLIEPSLMPEGSTTPIRITGTGLGEDLTVTILQGGVPAGNLAVREFFSKDTSAGLTLVGTTLPGLAAGALSNYVIRFTRAGEPPADVSFSVVGLEEFVVESGTTTLTNPPAKLVSEMRIGPGGTVILESGKLDITATGPIRIDGSIVARGFDGATGSGRHGGTGADHGGSGGMGIGRAPIREFGVTISDEVGDGNFGRDGNAVYLFGGVPGGRGGDPGLGLEFNIQGLISDISACILIPEPLTKAAACKNAISSTINFGRTISDLSQGVQTGFRGYGAAITSESPLDGLGGGGGGGSGCVQIPISFKAVAVKFV